ncbi:MAG TPA: hypothetical protein VIO61_03230 [Anaerolineaceae bacterium]
MDNSWLGFLFTLMPFFICFGGVFLVIGGIFIVLMVSGAGQWSRLAKNVLNAKPVHLASANRQSGIVRVHGRISAIDHPVETPSGARLALLRLRAEGRRYRGYKEGYRTTSLFDKTIARPFMLDDGTGTAWVQPLPLDKRLLGSGTSPTYEQVVEVLELLGMDYSTCGAVYNRDHFTLWSLQQDQELTIIGPLSARGEQAFLEKQGADFVTLTTLDDTAIQKEVEGGKKKTRILTIFVAALLAIFAAVPICGLIMLIVTMLRSSGSIP